MFITPQISNYRLEIHAVDSGSPQLTGSAFINVVILDVNDQPPQFDQSNYTAVVQVSTTCQRPNT